MTAIADPPADPFAPPSAPGPLGEPEPRPVSVPDRDESAVALGLAAAFLVARGLASAWLSRQEPDLSGTLSRQAWDSTGAFEPAAVGPLTRGYTAGGLSSEQATRAATAYAASLGEHLAETSGQAMIDGLNAQLAARWPVRTAWARAAAGYGLDGPTMLAWIRALMSTERLPSAARVEDLLMARAMLMGRTEAFRARNSGLALGWVWMQQNGLLGEQTAKMWRTARDELTCPFCLSLDGQTVGLTEPFRYPDGTEIFCPPSHPNCRCVPELAGLATPTIERELQLVGKLWTPEQAREHPRAAGGRWGDKPGQLALGGAAVAGAAGAAGYGALRRTRPAAPVLGRAAWAGISGATVLAGVTALGMRRFSAGSALLPLFRRAAEAAPAPAARSYAETLAGFAKPSPYRRTSMRGTLDDYAKHDPAAREQDYGPVLDQILSMGHGELRALLHEFRTDDTGRYWRIEERPPELSALLGGTTFPDKLQTALYARPAELARHPVAAKRAQAYLRLWQAADPHETPPQLFRGMYMLDLPAGHRVGDELNLGLAASFTEDQHYAADFTARTLTQRPGGSGGLYVIGRGDAKAISLGPHGEQEWLVGGRFTVASRDESADASHAVYHLKPVDPSHTTLEKAWDPQQAAKHPHKGPGEGRGQFARVGGREPEPEVEAPPEPAPQVRDVFAEARHDVFAAPRDPFAAPRIDIFAAARTDPFAAARAQTQPQSATDVFAAARHDVFAEARAARRVQVVPQTLHRILLVVPPKPGRRDLPDRPPQWSITRAELESDGGGGKVPLDGLLPPSGGDVVDFDKITVYAKLNPAEQESVGINPLFDQIPAETLDRHYRRRPRARLNPSTFSPSEMLLERPRPGEDPFWNNPRHDTTHARLDAYMLADAITSSSPEGGAERPLPMSDGYLNDIFLNSGWDYHREYGEQQPGRPYISSKAMTREQKAAAIVEATKQPDTAAQVALSQAYMDQVVYTLPYVTVPESAKNLKALQQDMLHFVGDAPIDYGRFSGVPMQDIYVFADGFNPPPSILGGHNDARGEYRPLAGRYQVDDIIYESDHSVPGIAAVRWIYLKPLGGPRGG